MAIISSDVATGRKMNWRDGFTARRVQVFPNDPVFLRSQQEALSLASAKASRRVCMGHSRSDSVEQEKTEKTEGKIQHNSRSPIGDTCYHRAFSLWRSQKLRFLLFD